MIAYYFSEYHNPTKIETYLDDNNYFKKEKNKKNNHRCNKYSYKYKKITILCQLSLIITKLEKITFLFWVVIHFITFGELSKLYSILINDVKDNIVSCCQNLFETEYGTHLTIDKLFIGTFLKSCSRFRNAAGHNERFYNYTIKEFLNLSNTSGITIIIKSYSPFMKD